MLKNNDTLVNAECGNGLSFNFYNLGSLAYWKFLVCTYIHTHTRTYVCTTHALPCWDVYVCKYVHTLCS